MKIEAIFQFEQAFKGWSDNSLLVKARPIADADGKYKDFFEATPSGSLELNLSAKAEAVQELFKDAKWGKLYKVTVEEVVE